MPYATVPLVIDAQPPAAPAIDDESQTLGSMLTVMWTGPSPEFDNMNGWDYEWEARATCDDNATLIDSGETSRAVTAEVNIGDLGDGGSACFRVRAKDQAGNVGAWSGTLMLEKASGIGFCGVVDGGCPSGCSAAAAQRGEWWMLAGIALLWRRGR